MSGIVHAYALAGAEGIAARDLAVYARGIADLLPDIVDEYAGQADDGHYPADVSNILSAAAGMEHIIHAARAHGMDVGMLSAGVAIARRAIDAGHGTDNFSRLVQVLGKGGTAAVSGSPEETIRTGVGNG